MNKARKGLIAVGLLAACSTLAIAAGNYSTYPIVGEPSFCASGNPASSGVGGTTGQQGSPNTCVQTVPAGPPGITGVEQIPADTQLSTSAPPQTVTIPSALLSHGMDRNRLIGGDFTINLWQRGTTPLSNVAATTARMTADRWWAITPSGHIDVLEHTPAATDADFLGNIGFLDSLELRRHTGSTGALSCIGQTLDQNAALPLIGNNAVFSFYGYAPTTYSATNSAITVSVAYFTAADTAATQATIGYAGGNGSKAALAAAGQAGGPTNYTAAVGGVSVGTGTVASGVATINLTQTPTRYAVYAPIPALTAAGTQVTGVSVAICGTFVATASATTDWFEIFGAQLESKPSTVTNTLSAGVTAPTGFERRNPQDEANLQYAYSHVITEGAATAPRGPCAAQSDASLVCLVNHPIPLRITPVSVATSAGFASTAAAGATLVACTSITVPATTPASNTETQFILPLTCNGGTSYGSGGVASFLWDDAQSGQIQTSAEP